MEINLRTQYPLSPKKFWKKIIEKSILILFISFLVSIPSLMLYQEIFLPSFSIGLMLMIGVAVGIVLFFIFTGIYAIYVTHYIRTYEYSDDGDFLTIKKGVFAPTEIHVQYLKIQDVYVDQDILDRIMGLYDVHISSATYSSGMEAHIDGVEKEAADGLKKLLLGKIKRSTTPNAVPHHASHTEHAQGGHGYMGGGEAEASHASSTSHTSRAAHFSTPISSEVYGLSNEWWVSEFVKIALNTVITPLFISLWFYVAMTDNDMPMTHEKWRYMFYVWLAAFLFLLVYRSIYLFLWKKHYSYTFGDEYIYMKIGVLSISEKNMGYNTIQDVKVNQSFVDRIFGVADLVIENASPSMVMSRNGGQEPNGSNGIVIEGLSLADAKRISEEMKKVILTTSTPAKGL